MRIVIEFLFGQSAGQLAIHVVEGQIESVFKMVAEFVAHIAENPLGVLRAVFAETVARAAHDRADVIKPARNPAEGDLAAEITKASAFEPNLERVDLVPVMVTRLIAPPSVMEPYLKASAPRNTSAYLIVARSKSSRIASPSALVEGETVEHELHSQAARPPTGFPIRELRLW